MTTSYKTLSRAQAGRQPDAKYDRQRFDNYTSWLDLQVRAKQQAEKVLQAKKPEGDLYGFSNSTTEVPVPLSEPFDVQESSFTSGYIVRRRYDKQDKVTPQIKMVSVRTDPWHYPNSQAVNEREHYDDYRSGSCSENNPKNRPSDRERAAAVSDEMVKQWVASESGGKASHMDKALSEVLFGKDIDMRPDPQTLKDLNVDLSCAQMPRAVTAAVDAGRKSAESKSQRRDMNWGWCLDYQNRRGDPGATTGGLLLPEDLRDAEAEKFEAASATQDSFHGGRAHPTRPGSVGGASRTASQSRLGAPTLGPGPGPGPGGALLLDLKAVRGLLGNEEKVENHDAINIVSMSMGEPPTGCIVPSGGSNARKGFAGTWSVCQGAGPGIGQFPWARGAQ